MQLAKQDCYRIPFSLQPFSWQHARAIYTNTTFQYLTQNETNSQTTKSN